MVAEQGADEVLEAVEALAQAGLAAASAFDARASSLGEAELLEAVGAQLHGAQFAELCVGAPGVDHEAQLDRLTGLCGAYGGAIFARAFAERSGASFKPRLRRMLALLAIGQVLSDPEPRAQARAARAYLALLSLPGALSYQMLQPAVLRLLLDRLPGMPQRDELLRVVAALPTDAAILARLRDTQLAEPLMDSLVLLGAALVETHDRQAVVKALTTLVGGKDSGKKDGAKVAKGVDQEQEQEQEQEEEEEEEEELARRHGRTGTSSEEQDAKAEAHLFRALLRAFQQGRGEKQLAWPTEVLAALVQREGKGTGSVAALKMLEHVTFNVPARADARAAVAASVQALLRGVALSPATVRGFASFLGKLSNSREAEQRAFAVQVAGDVLCSCELDADLREGVADLVLCRADDRVVAVRAAACKALGLFVSAFASPCGDLERQLLLQALRALRRRAMDAKPGVRRVAAKALQDMLCSEQVRDMRGVDRLIERDFARLCERSRDTSPLIRGVVLQTAARFYEREDDPRVLDLWASTVLPLVFDAEQSVQRSARAAVQAAVFQAVLDWRQGASDKVWRLLARVGDQEAACLHKALLDLCTPATAQAFSPQRLASKLQEAAVTASGEEGAERAAGAWMLLDLLVGGGALGKDSNAELARIKKKGLLGVDIGLVVEAFDALFVPDTDRMEGDEDEEEEQESPEAKAKKRAEGKPPVSKTKRHLLQVLTGAAHRVPASEATRISATLFALLNACELENDLARNGLRLIVALCTAKAPNESKAASMIKAFGGKLAEQCESVLAELHSSGGELGRDSNQLVSRVLFLVGELAILGLDPNEKGTALLPFSETLATLTLGVLAMEAWEAEAPGDGDADNDNEAAGAGDGEEEGNSNGLKKNPLFAAFEAMRAHAFVATGKICLRDEQTAKRATHMLVRELDTCKYSAVVRSNVIVILGDLCRRYTNLIDPHMDTISACLADPCAEVRRNAVVLLTGLLQEDYIKWRGQLFVRFLMCAVDPNAEVRDLVQYTLKNVFPLKSPGLFHGQFVEVLHALTRCATPKYQVAHQLCPVDAQGLPQKPANVLHRYRLKYVLRVTANTEAGRAMRAKLYALLLAHMSDTHRLEVTNKICRDVFGEILDGHLSLPRSHVPRGACEPVDMLLRESFAVLCSPGIRVRATSGSAAAAAAAVTAAEDEAAVMASDAAQKRLEEAKHKVLAKLERKNLMEHVIPMIVSFYRLLQRERSSHLRFASLFLRTLLKDYKDEMEQVLATDRLLREEIAYDLEQFEREEERRQEDASHAAEGGATPLSGRKHRVALSARKSSSSKGRRRSSVSFQPAARDLGARSTTGVLKTPIPLSSKKRRRTMGLGDLAKLQPGSAPRLARATGSGDSALPLSTGQRKRARLTLDGGLQQAPSTALRSRRRWSVQPRDAGSPEKISKNLAAQLKAL